MDIEARLTTTASPAAVMRYVDDLSAYPAWMSLVHSAAPTLGATSPTWVVELRAAVGPFARSKRLRIVRTVREMPGDQSSAGRVVFERQEDDGREHAAWRLEAVVSSVVSSASTANAPVTELVMRLHYNGKLFQSVVEAILQQHIDAGRTKLGAMLAVP